MARRLPILATTATHLIAAGLGLAVWAVVKPEDVADSPAAKEKVAENFRRERRTERPADGLSGDELLTRITGKDEPRRTIEEVPDESTRGERLRKQIDGISTFADSVEPAENLSEAAKGALAKFQEFSESNDWDARLAATQMAQARLLHWLREDPKAALAFDFRSFDRYGSLNLVFTSAVNEMGAAAALDLLGTSASGDTELRKSLASVTGMKGDMDSVRLMKDKISAARWGDVRTQMAAVWPMGKVDDFLAFVTEEKAPLALANFAKVNGENGLEWLRTQMASDTMDPELRAGILKKPEYRDLFYDNPKLPYEERLAALTEASPNQSPEEIKFSIGMRDVLGVLDQGRDWRYAFRNGAASYDEIYNAVAAELPSLAASAPDAIRNHLLKELAEDNGPAVMAELASLPEAQRWEAAIKPARSMFYSVNPQDLYDYLQHIPGDAGGESVWEQRLQAWTNQTPHNRVRFDDAYVEWVRNLPEGLDREMAAFALVKNGDESMRAEIRDPKLVQRLEVGR